MTMPSQNIKQNTDAERGVPAGKAPTRAHEPNHTITIKNLGPIKEIKNFEVKDINAVIGESATGKSLLVKAIFAFNEPEFITSLFGDDLKNLTFQDAGFFDAYKSYTIDYDYGNEFDIKVEKNDGKTAITLSEKLKKEITDVQKRQTAIDTRATDGSANERGVDPDDLEGGYGRSVYGALELRERTRYNDRKVISILCDKLNILSVIFIPDAKNFVADYDNLRLSYISRPAFRRGGKNEIPDNDRALTSFSEMYRDFIINFDKLSHPLMRGNVTKLVGNTLKFTIDGQVLDMSEISSGQKALFPILLTLQAIEKEGKPYLIIIEEPEAHIFPKDQKLILDRIIEFANSTQSKIFLTTHSPYILMAMNNLIEARTSKYKSLKDKFIDFDKTNVQKLANGKAESILDHESRLISLDYIEKIENDLVDEFHKILHSDG